MVKSDVAAVTAAVDLAQKPSASWETGCYRSNTNDELRIACAKIIINAGIKKVIAAKDYHQRKKSKEAFGISGVQFVLVSDEVEKYDHQ